MEDTNKNTVNSIDAVNHVLEIEKELELLAITNMPAQVIAAKYSSEQLIELMATVSEQLKNTPTNHLSTMDLASKILVAGIPHTAGQVMTTSLIIGCGWGSGVALNSLLGVSVMGSTAPVLLAIPVAFCSNAIVNDHEACYSAGQRVGHLLNKLNPFNRRKNKTEEKEISDE